MQLPTVASETARESLLTLCVYAAFADGEKSEAERAEVRRMAEDLGIADPATAVRQVLMGRTTMQAVCGALTTPGERALAYEMALGVCEASGSVSAGEREFLDQLKKDLGLGEAAAGEIQNEVDAVAMVPVASAAPAVAVPDQSGMILKYSILNGALELLPETMATLAIVPMQMKMVYRIGKAHGAELDRSHIKEFLATAGLGLGSQVVEGFARQLMRGLGRKVAGKMAGRIADQVTGSAFSFASTYAIGHVAEKYYAGGRRLDAASLKAMFVPLQDQARELHTKYLPEIQEKAKTLTPSSILSMVQGNGPA